MSPLFVTATGTDVGKTYVACALLRALTRRGFAIEVLKPVLSGFDDVAGSDAGRLLEAMGRPHADVDQISPWRYSAPLAPPSAARLEGAEIRLRDLIALCRSRTGSGPLLVEGAGGVMSPIAEDGTNLDLIVEIGASALLVAGSYLGSVSHTLSALHVLRSHGVAVAALVISESEGDPPPMSEMTDALNRYAEPMRVFIAPRAERWDAEALADALYGRP